jgi:hypothetical protein
MVCFLYERSSSVMDILIISKNSTLTVETLALTLVLLDK